MNNRIAIITPDGRRATIPEENVEKALQRGYTLAADLPAGSEDELVAIIDPSGRTGKVPKRNLEKALARGYQLAEDLPMGSQAQGDSWGALIGKSALKGLGAIADIPRGGVEALQNIVNQGGLADATNLLRASLGDREAIESSPQLDIAKYVPSTTDAREVLKNYTGVDLEPHPTTGAQRVAANAAEFAGGLGPFGLAGQGSSLGAKALQGFKQAGTGATIGATSGALQEAGVNPLVADIGASALTPTPTGLLNGFRKVKELPSKAALGAIGLSPNKFNLEAAIAARDLGIDLPAAALTDSKLTALADQLVGKTPFFGNRLAKKYNLAEEQSKNVLNEIYDAVSPKRTPELEAAIKKAYDDRIAMLPEGAKVIPNKLADAIDNTKFDTAILSPGQKEVLNIGSNINQQIRPESAFSKGVNPDILREHGEVKIPLQEYPVSTLAGTKQSLNDMINRDAPTSVRDLARKFGYAASEDIAEYGKTNPAWYKKFREADAMYGNLAKRETLEKTLGSAINPSTGDLGYAALSKKIHRPELNAIMKRDVSPEIFEKIEKLGKVSRAMAQKNRNIPNPSGTAPTQFVLGILSTLHTPSTIASVIGGEAATRLLTDKKFLDMAIKYAENPKARFSLPVAINKRVQDLTGVPALVLSRELTRAQNEQYGGEQ